MWKNADPDLLATAGSIRVAACVVAVEALMAAPVAKGEGIFRKMEGAAAFCLADVAVVDRLSQHDRQPMPTGELRFIGKYNLRIRRFRRTSTELTVFSSM